MSTNRKYEGDIKLPPKNVAVFRFASWSHDVKYISKGDGTYKRTMFGLRRGLKIVHIGDGVWRIGRPKEVKGKGIHQVIYSPEGKEYHIWDKDTIESLKTDYDKEHPEYAGEYFNRQGNQVDEAKLKIFILTHILDSSDNWNFDLNIIPPIGYLKVIYDNGMVKNINFNGTFEKIKRPKYEEYSDCNSDWTFIKPIGYRINK